MKEKNTFFHPPPIQLSLCPETTTLANVLLPATPEDSFKKHLLGLDKKPEFVHVQN